MASTIKLPEVLYKVSVKNTGGVRPSPVLWNHCVWRRMSLAAPQPQSQLALLNSLRLARAMIVPVLKDE